MALREHAAARDRVGGLTMAERHSLQILVLYYSRFGALELLAERIAEGARGVAGANVSLLRVHHEPVNQPAPGEARSGLPEARAVTLSQLTGADALVVGSPAYFGSMASAVKRLFEDCLAFGPPPGVDRSRPWRHYLFRDKVGAAFTTSGTPHGGNELALHSMLTLFMHLGMLVVTPGQAEPILENQAAPYGATAITGPAGNQLPTETDQDAARALGRRVAEVATWLRLGRTVWEQEHGPPGSGHSAGSRPPTNPRT